MQRVHLDTDIGSNPDDMAALAYLLARADVELTGITTVGDPDGHRAAAAAAVLRLADRQGVPVAAGPGDADLTAELLGASVEAGAVLVGIGPATNLAALQRRSPGTLHSARVVLMGGWPMPPVSEEQDRNAERDLAAASDVHRAAGALTIVPKSVTAGVPLRDGDLLRVRRCGPVGALLAEQVQAYHAAGRRYAHNDPLTAAVATGWDGVTVESRRLGERDADIILGVDAAAFAEHWVRTLESHARR